MSIQLIPQCQDLKGQVEKLLALYQSDRVFQQSDTTSVRQSLEKAISPTFEIVFAGAFSAGKSMLINALLERELLYSAEGHATGTECYIYYANPGEERVILTFLSEQDVRSQIQAFCERLSIPPSTLEESSLTKLYDQAISIIQKEGGKAKSDKAKQSDALSLLIDGFRHNANRIHPNENKIYSMEQLDFSSLREAAGFTRRGSNSAVLKKVEYYCHHPLLEDGNVIVDTPGIDAPVKADADRTYTKIADPNTSAVICILKSASTGELTQEETELLERIQANPSIRDRVFYIFNRVDETWYNSQLKDRLDNIISNQFRNVRVFKTSGLLGFYGSLLKHTSSADRFGLESVFNDTIKGIGGIEETPQFVSEFLKYCGSSGKLVGTQLKPEVRGYEPPLDNYLRILNDWGTDLIRHMVKDSGIEDFRVAVTRYLIEEKRPQLFATLAHDLQPLCINLRKSYLDLYRDLDSQPREVDSMISQELMKISQELARIGKEFHESVEKTVNQVIDGTDPDFESDFRRLQSRMVRRLDELLDTFSVDNAYSRATHSHPRNSTAPLLAVLVEAFYFLSNELEDILVDSAEYVITNFFVRLYQQVKNADYYQKLFRLLGTDNDLEDTLRSIEQVSRESMINGARKECDRYVRESPRFYDEGTFSIYQFRQVLQQTSQSFDIGAIRDAEPGIRQLLKLDFEPKIERTVRSHFRQETNNTLKTQLIPKTKEISEHILQRYPDAKANMEQTLAKEVEERLILNRQKLLNLLENVAIYNQLVEAINTCLKAMKLDREQLPPIIGLEPPQDQPKISSEPSHQTVQSLNAQEEVVQEVKEDEEPDLLENSSLDDFRDPL